MVIVILAVLGVCLGSFVNALVWRLHELSLPKKKRAAKERELSILKGRSMCPHCKHTLSAADLIPLVSWLALRGRCRYCHKPISRQYPLVELAMGLLFIASYHFWPLSLHTLAAKVAFGLWLLILVGLVALFIYDQKWMELPTKLIYSLWPLVIVYVVLSVITGLDGIRPLVEVVLGAALLGGLFYVLITISDKWIGGGDVRLGFLLGALVGSPSLALLLLFLASVLGCILSVPLLLSKRLKLKSKLAFGPLLIVATIIVQLFGQSIIHWYLNHFLAL